MDSTVINVNHFYIFAAIGLILPKVPLIGRFFNIINTLVHEFGHAFMSLLLQGKVHRIEVFSDTSGTATTQTKSRLGTFLVSVSGYLFASGFAYVSFWLISQSLYRYYIIGLTALFLIMLLFWVRNKYGVFWILLFALLNGVVIYYNFHLLDIALFYATTILTQSVISTLVLLYISLSSPPNAGDAANLRKLTHIPAFLWALGFVAFAVFVGYKVLQMLQIVLSA